MKKVSFILVLAIIVSILAGCSSTAKVESAEKPVAQAQVTVPAKAESTAAPVEEPAEKPYEWSFNVYDQTVTVAALDNLATVTVPSVVTEADFWAFGEAFYNDFKYLLKDAYVVPADNRTYVVTGLSQETVEVLTAFLDYQANTYVRQILDPDFVPVTKLSMDDEGNLLYTVNSTEGVFTLRFAENNVEIIVPEGLTQEDYLAVASYFDAKLPETFEDVTYSLTDNGVVLYFADLDTSEEAVALINEVDKDVYVLATYVNPETETTVAAVVPSAPAASATPAAPAATEAKPVETVAEKVESAAQKVGETVTTAAQSVAKTVTEAVSTAQQTVNEIASDVSETVKTEQKSTGVNSLAVILIVVGACILIGVVYYFFVYKKKNDKKSK